MKNQTKPKTKPRTIITTDLECDDMNSLIHLCLFLNEVDLDGVYIRLRSTTLTATVCTPLAK